MKTLAMIKMEKNFVAVLEKGYPRKPYLNFSAKYLLQRLKEEVDELDEEIMKMDSEEAKKECADVSNIVDYLYEKLSDEEPFLPEIEFVEQGLAWAKGNDLISLGNPERFMENLIEVILTHETIHNVIWRLEDYQTTEAFDNIFGMFHPSLLLMPEDYDFYIRQHVERAWNWWRQKVENPSQGAKQ